MAGEEKFRAPIQFDGIGPFPVTTLEESGFMMEYDRRRYPHRRYQDIRELAVTPLVQTGESPFLNGIEGFEDLWPQKFMQMRRRCQLPRPGYLRHWLYGNVKGIFSRWDPQYTTQTLNGCIVRWTFEQISEDKKEQLDIVNNNPLAGAKASAAVLDSALATLAAPPPARKSIFGNSTDLVVVATISTAQNLIAAPPAPITFPQFPSKTIAALFAKLPPFIELVDAFDRFISDQRNTFDQIAAEALRVQARYDEVLATPELLLPENAELMQEIISGKAAIGRAAIQAQESAAHMVTYQTRARMTPCEVAQEIYEDPGRGDEIMRYNPLDGSEYPAQTEIRFLDR